MAKKKKGMFFVKQGVESSNCRLNALNAFYQREKLSRSAFERHAAGAFGVVAHHFAGLFRDGVELAVGTHGEAVRSPGIAHELAHFSVEIDAVNFVVRGVGEKPWCRRHKRDGLG